MDNRENLYQDYISICDWKLQAINNQNFMDEVTDSNTGFENINFNNTNYSYINSDNENNINNQNLNFSNQNNQIDNQKKK